MYNDWYKKQEYPMKNGITDAQYYETSCIFWDIDNILPLLKYARDLKVDSLITDTNTSVW
jgi:hypothetical protein